MKTTIAFYKQSISGFESMCFEQRREAAARAKLDDKQHTKATLKHVFRVKPSKDAVSEYSYKNDFGQYVECYSLNQCVPMRKISKSGRTVAQQAASEKLAKLAKINSHDNKVALKAKRFIEKGNLVVIDTETTDIFGKVISIAVVDALTCDVIFESLVHTEDAINEQAFKVHGIAQDDLKNAPSFDDVSKSIFKLLEGKHWTAYNLHFDKTCLKNSCVNLEADHNKWIENSNFCIMYDIAVSLYGSTNRHGTISLHNALSECGLRFEGRAHTASADAIAAAKLLSEIANQAIE